MTPLFAWPVLPMIPDTPAVLWGVLACLVLIVLIGWIGRDVGRRR
jgi:hypothetical protein